MSKRRLGWKTTPESIHPRNGASLLPNRMAIVVHVGFNFGLFGCYSETTVYINFVASLCPTVQYIIFASIPFHASMSFIERVLGVVWAWWLSIVCVIFTSFPTLSQAPMGALPPFTSPETRVFLLPIFVAGCQARHAHRQSHVSNTSSAR